MTIPGLVSVMKDHSKQIELVTRRGKLSFARTPIPEPLNIEPVRAGELSDYDELPTQARHHSQTAVEIVERIFGPHHTSTVATNTQEEVNSVQLGADDFSKLRQLFQLLDTLDRELVGGVQGAA